jgi:hypothetical protein
MYHTTQVDNASIQYSQVVLAEFGLDQYFAETHNLIFTSISEMKKYAITYRGQKYVAFKDLADYLYDEFDSIADYLEAKGYTTQDLADDLKLEKTDPTANWSDDDQIVDCIIAAWALDTVTVDRLDEDEQLLLPDSI